MTIFFLGFSLVFYVLFGGADFGAGVLEIISGEGDRETIAHAIGPVWEANHVWLILVVVILFMGFPKIYAAMSLYLHIPLLIMLIGIVFRGSTFAFMHYDTIKDRSIDIYNWIFKISSLLTPLFLGIIVGAAMLGRINPAAETFTEAFIYPWFNLFSFMVGLFTITLFTYLASVYLIGETNDEHRRNAFTRSAGELNIAAVVIGILVFAAGEWEGLSLISLFVDSWFAILMIIIATLLLPAVWWSLLKARVVFSRVFAAAQIVCIMLAWFQVQYPVVINMTDDFDGLTFHNTAAPDATLLQLIIALVLGSVIILPFLFYLMKTFKEQQFKK